MICCASSEQGRPRSRHSHRRIFPPLAKGGQGGWTGSSQAHGLRTSGLHERRAPDLGARSSWLLDPCPPPLAPPLPGGKNVRRSRDLYLGWVLYHCPSPVRSRSWWLLDPCPPPVPSRSWWLLDPCPPPLASPLQGGKRCAGGSSYWYLRWLRDSCPPARGARSWWLLNPCPPPLAPPLQGGERGGEG